MRIESQLKEWKEPSSLEIAKYRDIKNLPEIWKCLLPIVEAICSLHNEGQKITEKINRWAHRIGNLMNCLQYCLTEADKDSQMLMPRIYSIRWPSTTVNLPADVHQKKRLHQQITENSLEQQKTLLENECQNIFSQWTYQCEPFSLNELQSLWA
jgi:hypothetical protein